jgi:hypothetical protein
MMQQIGDCPNREVAQIPNRCDHYWPTLVQLFGAPEPG